MGNWTLRIRYRWHSPHQASKCHLRSAARDCRVASASPRLLYGNVTSRNSPTLFDMKHLRRPLLTFRCNLSTRRLANGVALLFLRLLRFFWGAFRHHDVLTLDLVVRSKDEGVRGGVVATARTFPNLSHFVVGEDTSSQPSNAKH